MNQFHNDIQDMMGFKDKVTASKEAAQEALRNAGIFTKDNQIAEPYEKVFKKMNENYLEKVKDEKTELDTKIGKLHSFIAGPDFSILRPKARTNLIRQLHIMGKYSQILGEGIVDLDESLQKS